MRDILRAETPGAPIRTVRSMEETMNESLSTERLTAVGPYDRRQLKGSASTRAHRVLRWACRAYSVARRDSHDFFEKNIPEFSGRSSRGLGPGRATARRRGVAAGPYLAHGRGAA